ncbi:nuclear receptor-interacting protein 3-like [Synchiropus splendidus]|uniref:nuclear receptor-interacting protein 3-like n=1 Tax=Synchiropus splendidus TaxID=270530 RepID=UPI00237EAE4D|nr:nuclear receptor-interacting protein 3-like [Synchiropus splendidus]
MLAGTRAEMRTDLGPPDAAVIRQQRRLKQAVRFLHRDSADLLPLDGLKKLGTSNQGQPHNILQKRFFEAKLCQGRLNISGVPPNNHSYNFTHLNSHGNEEEEDEDYIYVPCQCMGQELSLRIDTGCKHNLMSIKTVDRLGLKDFIEETRLETGGVSYHWKLNIVGHIESLSLTVGRLRIMCSFTVVETDEELISLGCKMLKTLKSVIDTEKQFLVFGRTTREQVHFSSRTIERNF